MTNQSIHSSAVIGEHCTIGAYAVIHAGVQIGDDVHIGDHAVLLEDTVVGAGSVIGPHAVLGRTPMSNARMKRAPAPLPALQIGSHVRIGSGAIIFRGTVIEDGVLVGDLASIRERVSIGSDSIVGQAVRVELNTRIGKRVLLETGSYITGDSVIEDDVFVGPEVSTSNDKYMGLRPYTYKGPYLEKGCRIGNHATLLPSVRVGAWAVVGAGSVVTHDISPGVTVIGVPATTLEPSNIRPDTGVTTNDGHDLRGANGDIADPPVVPLVDLSMQWTALEEDVLRTVQRVMRSGQYILGPEVAHLEEEVAEWCGVPHAVGVASGTDALVLALEAFGIGAGDEVITTPFTFFATVEAILRVGAKPVFADVDPLTYNIDPRLVETLITPSTKAIMPVHLFGQMSNMTALRRIADAHGLVIIEDACQAIGAKWGGGGIGSRGDAAAVSFFPTKNLGTFGDGGMVLAKDAAIADRVKRLRAHGSRVKYVHEEIGWNSRLDEIHAAILREKLPQLHQWTAERRKIAAFYDIQLHGIPVQVPRVAPPAYHVYHLYSIVTDERTALQQYLHAIGVQSQVYYPVPAHLQRAIANLGYHQGDLPVAEALSNRILSLPLFPGLPMEQQQRVIEGIASFFANDSHRMDVT